VSFRRWQGAIATLCSYWFFSVALYAQSTGRITGSVSDTSGAPVAGATVNLYMTGVTSVMATTTTTGEGLFSFAAVQAGSYDLSVENPGFSRFVTRGLVVNAARETTFPTIKLEIKSVEQSIEVMADTQTVQTANIENSTTVTQQQVANLPVLDRQVSMLFLTQPGVSS